MPRWIAALVLVAALSAPAHAEPKTITLDGCAKAEQELRKQGDRTTITVKCTGEALDPEVRKDIPRLSFNNGVITMPGITCSKGDGTTTPCH